MLFNTPEYVLFFCIIAFLFYIVNRKPYIVFRNVLLLFISYYFYAQLQPWFVTLLIYITVVNYSCGKWIMNENQKGEKGKKGVTTAILLSIGLLAFFKYAYLVNSSILLPIGISFFTFQALTYTIDIYRRKIEAEKNILNVALFIAFFPTLLSGPIERARNLCPQLKEATPMNWGNFIKGGQLFVWGLFKKVVIADRLAEYVNEIYSNPSIHTGSTLMVAAVFYSFQIYCDFSGYADMAIGSGRILGFRITKNFDLPYCANTFRGFWHRWHISLTSWFTEYVYISMGGNRVSKLRWLLNISTVFLLSGIWHGVTGSFILWGAIHTILYIGEYYAGPKRPKRLYHLFVFIMITFAWIFFRIEDSNTAWNITTRICTDFTSPIYWGTSAFTTMLGMFLLGILIIREYLLYKNILQSKSTLEYVLLFISISLLGVCSEQFVYFQF